ncbi:MAG: hypothetical protein JO128_17750 [Alphaproteobacteria bacterium]|nr:hypothetical protein [Alphaproteobacteria bacterium]
MNKIIGFAIFAAGALGGCTYEPPAPYAYFPVPCPSAGATVTPTPSGTVTPNPPPAPPAPVQAAVSSGQCVAVVPTYTTYPIYYYQGYYGPPIYSSFGINNPLH